jgi:hypothetical protein
MLASSPDQGRRQARLNQEDDMNFARTAASATALCIMLAATATIAAEATEPANPIGCVHMARKASAALDANQHSPNYQSAVDEAKGAKNYCNLGFYQQGVAHYAKVLEMLGVG